MSNRIQKIFSEVPHTYELVNHLLTFGLDIFWRNRLANLAARDGGNRWIDVCSGTGETAANLYRKRRDGTLVYAADFTREMLQKATEKPEGKFIHFVISDVKQLPFPDNHFDVVTISFATRNLNTHKAALIESFSEFHRILKPGGRFLNLETSQPSSSFVKKLYHLFIKIFVKPVGAAISGSKAGYAYLSHTIPRFYAADELADILKEAGFTTVEIHQQFLGIAAIHESYK